MKLLIGYGTKEGQTRKIARHIADFAIERGHSVELLSLKEADGLDLSRFDRVLLAAPVHAGHFPKALAHFVGDQARNLLTMPTAFIAVSLSAAGHDAEDWRGLEKILSDFAEATDWMPSSVLHVAGAYKPSEYDLFTRLLMRRIVQSKDPDMVPGEDKEYTDWMALDGWISDWMGDAA